jgi:outer membrane protein insertion porin family
VTTFRVNPGQRFRLVDVRFSGNVKLSDRELRRVITTAPTGGFRRLISAIFRRPTGITREQLSDDRDALESHYRLQGFSEAAVENPLLLTRPDGTMTVEFPINEGVQTLLAEVRVEGVEKIDRDDLPQLALQPGLPYNPQLERTDVIALQSFYADRGFAEVQVAPRVEISADKTTAKVTYTVAEGPQINIDQIIVRGNTYTDRDVVLRKAEIESGDPFSYGSILEAQRNLYRLGIFQRVDVQPEQAGTSLSDRNVVITVEEGRNLTVSGSIGLRVRRAGVQDEDRVSPRFAGGIAHRNLFGSGRYLGLETVVSGEENEAFLTYREPFIGRFNIPVQLSIFQTDDNTVSDRRVLQRGTSIEASRVAFLRTRWSLLYQYKISRCEGGQLCDDLERGILIPSLDRALLNIQIASITPTFFWDTRDDVIDPHRGFFTSASVEYASPVFSATAAFTKEFVQGSYYLPISQRSVFVVAARAGMIQARGTSEFGTNTVPPSERFTLGGDTTHRAYPLDLLGILCTDRGGNPLLDTENCRDTGLIDPETGEPIILGGTLYDLDADPNEFRLAPIGGNAVFGLNLEYRFPIFGSVGGAIFADAGNVFADDTIKFDQLQYGVGGGIRYLSPVGPLRIDIGWPMSRRIYDRTFSYSVTLGFPF